MILLACLLACSAQSPRKRSQEQVMRSNQDHMWKPAHDSALITRVNKPVKMRISFINCHWKINAAWDEHHTESHARDRNLSALSSDQADETSKGAAGRNKPLYLYMCFVKAWCKWKMKMKMYIYISICTCIYHIFYVLHTFYNNILFKNFYMHKNLSPVCHNVQSVMANLCAFEKSNRFEKSSNIPTMNENFIRVSSCSGEP